MKTTQRSPEYYRVYGKLKAGAKRFQPMDVGEGRFVGNLIYATLIPRAELEALRKTVDYLNRKNPEYLFEIRPVASQGGPV